MLVHGVPRDSEQPTAKSSDLRVVIEPSDRSCNRTQDILNNVRRVRVLQSLLAGKSMDQRTININELSPRFDVLRITNTQEETWSSYLRISQFGALALNVALFNSTFRVSQILPFHATTAVQPLSDPQNPYRIDHSPTEVAPGWRLETDRCVDWSLGGLVPTPFV